MKYPAQGYNATLQTISSANSVPWSVIDSLAIAETAWLSTIGNNATAQLGNPAKKYQTVAAAIAAGAKQLEIGPGTFDFDGTELTAYVRAVSPGQSTLRLAKTGATGEVGLPGNDATEGSNDAGGVGGTGGNGESLTLDINLRSDRSVNIEIDYAGGAGGEGGPGGNGDAGSGQGPQGDFGSQGLINGTIVLEGCIVGALSATVADQVTVAIESCNVTTSQPELITQFTNSLVNGVNTEIEETVTAANNAYLRVANGGTVTGPVVAQVLETRNGANATKVCVNGNYTNASNYVRGEIQSSASAVTITVDRAGTFATNNVNVVIQPVGSGRLLVNGTSTTGTFVANILTGLTTFANSGLKIESSGANLFNEVRASGGFGQWGINGEEMFFEATGTLSSGMVFLANSVACLRLTNVQNVLAGLPTRATNATSGFLYIPTCAGLPTGTPTSVTGMAPMVIDSTNNRLYFYSGGAWRLAGV